MGPEVVCGGGRAGGVVEEEVGGGGVGWGKGCWDRGRMGEWEVFFFFAKRIADVSGFLQFVSRYGFDRGESGED